MNNHTINLDYSKYDTSIYLKRKEEGYIYVAVQFPYSKQKYKPFALKFSTFVSLSQIHSEKTICESKYILYK